MEASKKKSPSPIAWVLGQAGPHRGQFVLSVVLAVLGVAFSVAPYFAVVGIVKGLMAGERTGRPSPCWARSASAAPRS